MQLNFSETHRLCVLEVRSWTPFVICRCVKGPRGIRPKQKAIKPRESHRSGTCSPDAEAPESELFSMWPKKNLLCPPLRRS